MSDQVKQPEPVAYGVFAFVDGAWWMQFPVYESEAKAHESYAMYAPGSALLTKPLYDAPVASHATEVEALRQDAERYRWLRQQDWFEGDLCVLRDPKRSLTSGAGLGADCPSHERLDAAIDAARAALKGD
jgi:hypothetical protein